MVTSLLLFFLYWTSRLSCLNNVTYWAFWVVFCRPVLIIVMLKLYHLLFRLNTAFVLSWLFYYYCSAMKYVQINYVSLLNCSEVEASMRYGVIIIRDIEPRIIFGDGISKNTLSLFCWWHGGEGVNKLVTNGDKGGREGQKSPFWRWHPFWMAPNTYKMRGGYFVVIDSCKMLQKLGKNAK